MPRVLWDYHDHFHHASHPWLLQTPPQVNTLYYPLLPLWFPGNYYILCISLTSSIPLTHLQAPCTLPAFTPVLWSENLYQQPGLWSCYSSSCLNWRWTAKDTLCYMDISSPTPSCCDSIGHFSQFPSFIDYFSSCLTFFISLPLTSSCVTFLSIQMTPASWAHYLTTTFPLLCHILPCHH